MTIFKQLNIIKSFFITENKYNLTKQNLEYTKSKYKSTNSK